jgi:N-acetylglucosamine-6-phosphate deacetylase
VDKLLIKGGLVVFPDRVISGDILIRGEKIARIGPNLVASKGKILEAAGLYIGPGFIDTHVNGGCGRSFMECTEEAFRVALNFHLSNGTTGLLPTAVAAPLGRMREFLKLVNKFQEGNPLVLGAHLNGPFVSLIKCGAMASEFILDPSQKKFRKLVKGLEETVRVVTLAPEENGAQGLIQEIMKIGAIPSLGHSDATYDQARLAIANGVRHFTHIFNAMRELHHREPGAVGAALDSDGVTMELIVDGLHVHPAAVRLLIKLKGPDSVLLITDAISATGAPDGEYCLGNVPVLVNGGLPRTKTGAFAGSTLTLNRAVKNLIKFTGIPLPAAIRTATLNPARLLGISRSKGSLETGKDADIAVFDAEFNVLATIAAGKILYVKNSASIMY